MSRAGRGRSRGQGRGQAPGERSLARKAVIVAALPLALLAAVMVQLTIVNRLPLPGGDAPDLVLLLVTAVAVRATPLTGTLAGFAGGLALDLAPPQAHYAGEYALVFCLAGYAAARAGTAAGEGAGDRSTLISLAIVAAATTAGEAGKAALGLLLSDPNVTGTAIRHVLPGAAGYDLLLSPVLLGLVSIAAGRPAAEYTPRPEFAAGRLAAVFRLASAGAAPGLRLAGSGPVHRGPSWARRQPRLRLADLRSRSSGGTNLAYSPTSLPLLAGGRATKLSFSSHGRSRSYGRRSRSYGGGAGGGYRGGAASYSVAGRRTRSPSRGWLRRGRARRPAPMRLRTPSRGWLHSSRRSPVGGPWPASAPSSQRRRRSRDPWRSRGRRSHPVRGYAAGSVPYVSRPYPTRKRSYRTRLLAIVGARR